MLLCVASGAACELANDKPEASPVAVLSLECCLRPARLHAVVGALGRGRPAWRASHSCFSSSSRPASARRLSSRSIEVVAPWRRLRGRRRGDHTLWVSHGRRSPSRCTLTDQKIPFGNGVDAKQSAVKRLPAHCDSLILVLDIFGGKGGLSGVSGSPPSTDEPCFSHSVVGWEAESSPESGPLRRGKPTTLLRTARRLSCWLHTTCTILGAKNNPTHKSHVESPLKTCCLGVEQSFESSDRFFVLSLVLTKGEPDS